MPWFPTSLGLRPRLAVEVRAEGVVAARADEGSPVLAGAARVQLGAGASVPQLRTGVASHGAGNEASHISLPAADRALLVAAIRSALEEVAGRGRDTTLVVPDAAARVLLLDFDGLPARAAEALPVVRFRLKKLVPFETDTAAVSYQVMSSTRGNIRALAVAMPGELVAEYEKLILEAGFAPGAVIPSTLAAIAGLPESDDPMLVVNAGRQGVTTAIARGNVLLLHRSIDLAGPGVSTPDLDFEQTLPQPEAAWELAQAVSVASAYFEDTLERRPGALLSSGTLAATTVSELLASAGVEPVIVEELVTRSMLSETANGRRVPLGWLAGVRGALAS